MDESANLVVLSVNRIRYVIPAEAGIQNRKLADTSDQNLPIKPFSGPIAKYHMLSVVGTDDWRKPFKSPFEKGGFLTWSYSSNPP
jgi:hypothetical protein